MKYARKIVLLVLLVLIIFGIGIIVGNDLGDPEGVPKHASGTSPSVAKNEVNINSLVNYRLPDGWGIQPCPEREDIILFIVPNTQKPSCNGPPNALVRMTVNPLSSLRCSSYETSVYLDLSVNNNECTEIDKNGRKNLKLTIERSGQTTHTYLIETDTYIVRLELVNNRENITDKTKEDFEKLYSSIQIK
ncbi:MAG: hypothetical protein ACR2FM_02500 [Candidatus Saccharimonadales bacterium]